MDTVYQAATEILARSSTLTAWAGSAGIIIGAIAGGSPAIVRGGGDGILMNIVIGVGRRPHRRVPAEGSTWNTGRLVVHAASPRCWGR